MDTPLRTFVLECFFILFAAAGLFLGSIFFSCVNLSLRYLGATVEAELRF